MVGYEAAAASVGLLLADSISLLGHKAGASSSSSRKPFGCSAFGAGCIRAHDFTSILCQERASLNAGEGVLSSDEKTVIGNLREVAERLAPGRACISVVSDHGFAKTAAPLNLFPRGGGANVIG